MSAGAESRKLPRILFVCIENSCRSQMAEAFARALAPGKVDAWSAGSLPSGKVHPRAVAFMSEVGIDMSGQRSKGLGDLPAGAAWDLIATMGCGDACPHLPARSRVDWEIPDPKEMSDEAFREVRDRLAALVRGALGRLLGAGPSAAAKEAG